MNFKWQWQWRSNVNDNDDNDNDIVFQLNFIDNYIVFQLNLNWSDCSEWREQSDHNCVDFIVLEFLNIVTTWIDITLELRI